VAPGDTVKVRNEDPDNHTVTSVKPGAFDVTITGGGGTASFKAPKTPGSYALVCTFHANMRGTLVVR
jgi:plastocyanin